MKKQLTIFIARLCYRGTIFIAQTLVLSVVPKFLCAQNLAFERLYCNTQYPIHDFLLTPTGSIFMVSYDTVNYSSQKTTAAIRKFDKDFNLVWEKKFGGSNFDEFNMLKYIGDNRILVRGNSQSTDGDVLNNYAYGNNEWVCILDTNGNLLHQLVYGASGSTTRSKNIQIGPNGDIYFCGSTYGNEFDFIDNGPFDFANDGYLACADSLLNKKWIKFFEVSAAGNSTIFDVHFLPNNHLLLTCASTVSDGAFSVNTPTANGATVIMEMDTLFNIYWQKRYGSNSALGGTLWKIYKDPNKWEYYVTGNTDKKDGDCWDNYPYLSSPDQNYHWLMKIDTLGNKIWSHIYGPFSDSGQTSMQGFSEVFANNVIHYADLVSGSDNHDFGTQIGVMDSWLIDIDSNGILSKHKRVGYPHVHWAPSGVKINPVTNERYYYYEMWNDTSGMSIPMHECTNLPLGHSYMIGKYHYWPDKLADAKEKTMELIVYPNPAKNEINVELLIKGTVIEIYAADGKKMSTMVASRQKETISVDGWRRGTYVVKAKYEDQIYAQKIIIH